jgi:hypothetical protein
MSSRTVFLVLSVAASFMMLGSMKTQADEAALMKAAHAALCGPAVKNLHVGGHDFNVKRASVNETSGGQPYKLGGQISHRLRFRPDDQIHYTIDYKDGLPYKTDARIDRGGVLQAVLGLPEWLGLLPKVEVFSGEISPDALRELNAELVVMFGGGKWEYQLASMLSFIGAAGATQPRDETCSMLRRESGGGTAPGGGGLGPGGGSDRPPIHEN